LKKLKHRRVEVVINYPVPLPKFLSEADELKQFSINLMHNGLQAIDNCLILKLEVREENQSRRSSVATELLGNFATNM